MAGAVPFDQKSRPLSVNAAVEFREVRDPR